MTNYYSTCNYKNQILNLPRYPTGDIKADLDYSRQAVEARKRLVQIAKDPFLLQESHSTLTTPMPADRPPTRKGRRKKKKKKKPRYRKLSTSTTTTTTTEATPTPVVLAAATTEAPWSTTTASPTVSKWRLVAERLFGSSPWSSGEDRRGDDSNIAKVRRGYLYFVAFFVRYYSL